MSLLIESKKLKRTGYLPAFLAGGFLAAAFPVVYMMVKAEEMTAFSYYIMKKEMPQHTRHFLHIKYQKKRAYCT